MKILVQAFLVLTLVSTCSFLGWNKTKKGTGLIVAVRQNVSQFDAISVENSFIVNFQQDANNHEVILEAHENLLSLVAITESKCCLSIRLKKEVRLASDALIKITIRAPRLRSAKIRGSVSLSMEPGYQDDIFMLEASGASLYQAENFIVDHLYAHISGAASANVAIQKSLHVDASGAAMFRYSGIATTADIKASGAAKIDGSNTWVDSADITTSGASSVLIAARNVLKVNASGAVLVRYKGQPAVELKTSGTASVKPLI